MCGKYQEEQCTQTQPHIQEYYWSVTVRNSSKLLIVLSIIIHLLTVLPWAWILESNAAITTASVAAARSCLEWRLSIAQKGAEI